MSIQAFNGGAGSGKTYSVMEQLEAELTAHPLLPHQRVLALTYMHGARHRLDEQLERIAVLRGRYEATTIDSFAWQICRRWRARISELGWDIPGTSDFELTCDVAARLLAEPLVGRWVAASYPIILVDEAQDLEPSRLSIIEGLIASCCVIIAFDDFQCLKSTNRPVAVLAWVQGKCMPTTLTASRRTSRNDLLLAASQVRSGVPLTASGPTFKVEVAPGRQNTPHVAVSKVGWVIAKGGTFALITPTKDKSPYARGIVDLLQTKVIDPVRGIGPFRIAWEGSADTRVNEVRKALAQQAAFGFAEAEACLSAYADLPPAVSTIGMLKRARDAKGALEFSSATVLEIFERNLTAARQFTRRRAGGRRAMTVHQAKNREFDHVVLIWPFQVTGNEEDRRRIFYNAITRARESCLVIVQDQTLLAQAPFV